MFSTLGPAAAVSLFILRLIISSSGSTTQQTANSNSIGNGISQRKGSDQSTARERDECDVIAGFADLRGHACKHPNTLICKSQRLRPVMLARLPKPLTPCLQTWPQEKKEQSQHPASPTICFLTLLQLLPTCIQLLLQQLLLCVPKGSAWVHGLQVPLLGRDFSSAILHNMFNT